MDIVSVVSIILDSVLASIAIIVSIIAIKRQTKEQELSNTIQLFEKRLNIYNYLEDIFKFSGTIFSYLELTNPQTTFAQFQKKMSKNKLSDFEKSSVSEFLESAGKIKNQALALFEHSLSKYIIETIEYFEEFFDSVLELDNNPDPATQQHYQTFKRLTNRIHDKEEGSVVSKINDYIILYDIKRKLKYRK